MAGTMPEVDRSLSCSILTLYRVWSDSELGFRVFELSDIIMSMPCERPFPEPFSSGAGFALSLVCSWFRIVSYGIGVLIVHHWIEGARILNHVYPCDSVAIGDGGSSVMFCLVGRFIDREKVCMLDASSSLWLFGWISELIEWSWCEGAASVIGLSFCLAFEWSL
jgi:hypothetical protein